MKCFFVSDLHGKVERYAKLFERIEHECPDAVFIGGDIMPHAFYRLSEESGMQQDFLNDVFLKGLEKLKRKTAHNYPRIFVILGNDDGMLPEAELQHAEQAGLLEYVHNKIIPFGQFTVFGYAYVPPTPFKLKDWEKYDVSRYVDPGCISPEDGFRSREVPVNKIRYSTIKKDLDELVREQNMSKSIFLFHVPPYKTSLDRAALDGIEVNHAPIDVHVGSIAVKKLIEQKQPLLTLHGHIHESSTLTGSWHEKLGSTLMVNAAYQGPQLSLVRFEPDDLGSISRELI